MSSTNGFQKASNIQRVPLRSSELSGGFRRGAGSLAVDQRAHHLFYEGVIGCKLILVA
mgnify:CR=1 FL=1